MDNKNLAMLTNMLTWPLFWLYSNIFSLVSFRVDSFLGKAMYLPVFIALLSNIISSVYMIAHPIIMNKILNALLFILTSFVFMIFLFMLTVSV